MSYLDSNVAKQMFQELKSKGYDDKAAAKEVQIKTGISAVTWEPVRSKSQQLGSWDGTEVDFNGFGIT